MINNTRRLIITLVAVLLPLSWAFSADLLHSIPVEGQAGLATADEAATAGLSDIALISTEKEYAGAVYELGGKFYRTSIVTSGSGREVGTFGIGLPHGAKLAALFHTHPTQGKTFADNSEYFSQADVETAKALGVPSYVGVVKTGTVIEYVPGKDRLFSIVSVSNASKLQQSAGHVIGTFARR